MEGILIAIVSGVFSLAGIWLGHYLAERNQLRKQRIVEPIKQGRTTKTLSKRRDDSSSDASFFRTPLWWFLATGVMAVSIGAALFVGWVIEYILSVFNVASPDVEVHWLALGLVGLAWGLTYIFIGTMTEDDVIGSVGVLFMPIANFFSPFGFSEFLRALLHALPFNVFISWGISLGIGIVAETQLGANLSGVVYIVFGIINFIGIASFLAEEL